MPLCSKRGSGWAYLPSGNSDQVDLEQTSLVRQAAAVFKEARQTHDRMVELWDRKLIARAELDTAISKLAVAEGRYQDAIEEVRNRQAVLVQRRSELEIARQQLADTVIVSPIDGAVSERQASVGQYLAAGAPVVTLVRTDPLRLRLAVPEREAGPVRVGQTVNLTVEGDAEQIPGPGRASLSGHRREQPNFDDRSRGAQRAGLLRPGSFAKADIVVEAGQQIVTVPRNSIVTFAGIEKVLMVAQGQIFEKRVRTGRRVGEQVEITEGISAGNQVIVQPGNLVAGAARDSGELMQKLAEISIRRPVFASMIILALVVVGAASYFRLGVDRFPSVDLPNVSVRTTLPGASPEEVETIISQPIEEVVNTVEGIDELRSVSGQGTSFVIATFNLDRDIDVAAQDVRDRVATVLNRLPHDIDPPVISKFNNEDSPILTIAVSGDRSLRELTEIADKIVKVQLERSAGVGEVRIVGGLERAINIWIDADRLAAYQIPITTVRDAIQRQNADIPGGNVTSGAREEVLRTMGRITDPRAFNDLVISDR